MDGQSELTLNQITLNITVEPWPTVAGRPLPLPEIQHHIGVNLAVLKPLITGFEAIEDNRLLDIQIHCMEIPRPVQVEEIKRVIDIGLNEMMTQEDDEEDEEQVA